MNENQNDKSLENLDSEEITEKNDIPGDENLENEEDVDANLEDSTDESLEDDAGQEDHVPLAKHIDLKTKYKAVKRELAEIADAKLEQSIRDKKQELKQDFLNKNYDEKTASDLADTMAKMYADLKKDSPKQMDTVLDSEIEELKSDPFYSDIGEYSQTIKEKINKAKRAGLDISVKEAYLNSVNVDVKLKEYKTHNAAKSRVNNINKGGNGGANVPTAGGADTKPQYNLDLADKKALEGLRKAQPEAKWTAKKYYEMMVKQE